MIMSWLTNLENTFVKDETWVVSELAKGWAALQADETTAETDILGIFSWLNTYHSQIISVASTALNGLATIGALIPQTAPMVATATTAIDAATAAIDVLSKGIQKGSTPLSTAVNAYHAVKTAQSAVNVVLKAKTAAPVPAPAT